MVNKSAGTKGRGRRDDQDRAAAAVALALSQASPGAKSLSGEELASELTRGVEALISKSGGSLRTVAWCLALQEEDQHDAVSALIDGGKKNWGRASVAAALGAAPDEGLVRLVEATAGRWRQALLELQRAPHVVLAKLRSADERGPCRDCGSADGHAVVRSGASGRSWEGASSVAFYICHACIPEGHKGASIRDE